MPGWTILPFLLAAQPADAAPSTALPSAVRCAALFAVTEEALKQKSGDPAMTAGFEADAAALRQIVVDRAKGDQAEADLAIGAERKTLKGEPSPDALKPCYRVKALG